MAHCVKREHPGHRGDEGAQRGRNVQVRSWHLHTRSELSFAELARRINPVVTGWINYFGRFRSSALDPLLQRINAYLVRWIRQKYKRLAAKRKALAKLREIAQQYPRMGRPRHRERGTGAGECRAARRDGPRGGNRGGNRGRGWSRRLDRNQRDGRLEATWVVSSPSVRERSRRRLPWRRCMWCSSWSGRWRRTACSTGR
ncbi:group II intron maturase-specific domain-containing protein [Streptomyces sp. NPDC057908]|uniref:group II intron maturase-specific domain-containing protein n=1 Tax=Streptomyces sp. NPDC057908 TaxID=3346276 RepID=UPI0036EE7B7B